MSLALVSVLFSFILIYIAKIPLSYAMYKLDNHFDNQYPRDQQARLTGFGKRALGAHLNSFESFPAFGIAVLFALYFHAPEAYLDILSISFVILRVLYIVFYWTNHHILRSTVWLLGFFVTLGIFVLALTP